MKSRKTSFTKLNRLPLSRVERAKAQRFDSMKVKSLEIFEKIVIATVSGLAVKLIMMWL